MEKIGNNPNKYWKKYYSETAAFTLSSSFCKFVCDTIDLTNMRVLELCCGDGRDTFVLGHHCSSITAVDYASTITSSKNITFIKSDINDFLKFKKPSNYDLVYCRFGIHSVTEDIEDQILQFSNYIAFEFRSDKDNSFIDDHYRRTINGSNFIKKLLQNQFEICYYKEATNLAVYKDQDPVIIRVVARKEV
tara:strand:- start:19370 stop:19942 length:573 start_codon:yes stop_codon:yes gene_type:complete